MIYPLRSVTAMIVAAGAVLTGTVGHAAQGRLTCPGTVQVGQHSPTDISVDVGSTPLGAYSVTVTYDPAVLTIASVAGGNSPEFSGSPTTNSGSFTSGGTNISAFQTASLTGPTGIVSITRLTFNAVGPAARTTVGLTVRRLFDTNSIPISATATGCVVAVTGDGTTTSSTSSTTTTIPTGIPSELNAIDSAIGALIAEVQSEQIRPHVRDRLLRQLERSRRQVERAAALLAQQRVRQADAALQQASRWTISFRIRVGSLAGRRSGADRDALVSAANAILNAVRDVQ